MTNNKSYAGQINRLTRVVAGLFLSAPAHAKCGTKISGYQKCGWEFSSPSPLICIPRKTAAQDFSPISEEIFWVVVVGNINLLNEYFGVMILVFFPYVRDNTKKYLQFSFLEAFSSPKNVRFISLTLTGRAKNGPNQFGIATQIIHDHGFSREKSSF